MQRAILYINTETWPSILGVGHEAFDLAWQKQNIIMK
jgi:hypothetical protein